MPVIQGKWYEVIPPESDGEKIGFWVDRNDDFGRLSVPRLIEKLKVLLATS